MVLQIAVHKVFSHLPGGLGDFSDNNSLLFNHPTIFHPSLISTIQQQILLSIVVGLFQQCHLFRIVKVSKFDVSVIILHRICQIPMNCKKMTFGFSDGSRNFRKLLSVSGEFFVFHGQD